jgi:hypothetical protein
MMIYELREIEGKVFEKIKSSSNLRDLAVMIDDMAS